MSSSTPALLDLSMHIGCRRTLFLLVVRVDQCSRRKCDVRQRCNTPIGCPLGSIRVRSEDKTMPAISEKCSRL
jgi:hypothetical protein